MLYIGSTRIFGVSIISQSAQLSYGIQIQIVNGVNESASNIVTRPKGGSFELKFAVSGGYVFDNAFSTNCEYS